MRKHLIAVDIGGSKISCLAREVESGADVFADKVATPAGGDLRAILDVLDGWMDAIPGGRAGVAALGVAVPGAVDDKGHVLEAGNLKGWHDVPLRTTLQRRYKVPAFVEHDANCGALGEKYYGAGVGLESFAFVALGTGIGVGFFLDGRLYRGAHHAAGEAGNLVFFPGESEEHTLFDDIGKHAIRKKVKRVAGKKLKPAEALALARRDRRLRRATRPAVDSLAATVVAIGTLLDPEAILFGGGTSEAGEALLARVRRRTAAHMSRRTRLIRAWLGANAQLHGALWGAAQRAGIGRK